MRNVVLMSAGGVEQCFDSVSWDQLLKLGKLFGWRPARRWPIGRLSACDGYAMTDLEAQSLADTVDATMADIPDDFQPGVNWTIHLIAKAGWCVDEFEKAQWARRVAEDDSVDEEGEEQLFPITYWGGRKDQLRQQTAMLRRPPVVVSRGFCFMRLAEPPSIAQFEVRSRDWRLAMLLARAYGWAPTGTRAPAWSFAKRSQRKCLVRSWSGSYMEGAEEEVTRGDAVRLSSALQQAMQDLPNEDVRGPCRRPANLPPDSAGINVFSWFSGPGKERLRGLIEFCQGGSFTIV